MVNTHYCQEHQTKFFRNEKANDKGQLDVWYSHKKADGSGFCTEPKNLSILEDTKPQEQSNLSSMFACNAMNNAVALASAGKIDMQKIGETYKKLLDELQTSSI